MKITEYKTYNVVISIASVYKSHSTYFLCKHLFKIVTLKIVHLILKPPTEFSILHLFLKSLTEFSVPYLILKPHTKFSILDKSLNLK